MKVRKQGNSLMVAVPRKFGIKPGTEVIAIKGRNDSWGYTPKISNPFTDPHVNFSRPHELTGNDKLEGREKI